MVAFRKWSFSWGIRAPVALAALACLLLAQPVEPAAAKGRKLIASDTAADPNPIRFWGKVDCANDTRQMLVPTDGDPGGTATGAPQGNSSYRQLTVLDGDDYWGERCELGWNDDRSPVAFYHEGQLRITYFSVRLPASFPLWTDDWQGVLQMKQAAPADNSSGAPVISFGAYAGEWKLFNSAPGLTELDKEIWSAPAQSGRWTRFALDVTYSQTRRKGRIKTFADLNGDLDFADPGESSRRMRTNTLKTEIDGTASDRHRKGDSLPSHLRVGIYHDSTIPCSAPTGCSVDIDNVQVLAAK